jgi:hypothetical protein
MTTLQIEKVWFQTDKQDNNIGDLYSIVYEEFEENFLFTKNWKTWNKTIINELHQLGNKEKNEEQQAHRNYAISNIIASKEYKTF